MSSYTAEDRVAQTILDQIGVGALMRLGAHDVTRYLDAVTFNIKVSKPGQRQARIMLVKIDLMPADLYNLSIGFLDHRKMDWYSLEQVKGIYAEDMVRIMHELAKRA